MDIKKFFEDNNIEYWVEGKNVSIGWININCLFCDDPSNHLGINPEDFKVNCWRCGRHSFEKIIMNIVGCDFETAKEIKKKIKKSTNPGVEDYKPPFGNGASSQESKRRVILPQGIEKKFPEPHLEYLRNRGFSNPYKIIKKYKLSSTYTIGEYKFRIIIPIYMNKKLVCFTSRDITDQQKLRYKTASNEESIIRAKRTIYNYDTIITGGDIIIVEGPVDVWKMGDFTVSILGIQHTLHQIDLLVKKNLRNVFILFDKGKKEKIAAYKFAKVLSPLVKNVEVVTLKNVSDPGKLTIIEAKYIKKQLLNNI